MASLNPILKKSYWLFAGIGGLWALFMISLVNPTIQRHALYSHKIHTGYTRYGSNVSNPEEFGFSKGQVTPFWLPTIDGESLFCWHVLPLDVYLDNERELVQTVGRVEEGLEGTVGLKLLRRDAKSRVVVNFHGNAGHIAQGWRPSTYRSLVAIPHTHVLTCDYRGFGISTLNSPPHIPTEAGIITDGISLISYVLSTLKQPASRTVLLGQSLGTAVTAASALYFTDPESTLLPESVKIILPELKKPESFAGVIMVSPFPNLPELVKTYKIKGIIPILSPLTPYPRIANWLSSKIIDQWPTLQRLEALLTASSSSKTPVHITIIHSRNDQDIDFRLSEVIYTHLEKSFLGEENTLTNQERRSIQGGDRVKRGAFAYRNVEDAESTRSVELEIARYGGHNELVGWTQVNLAVRRAFKGRKTGKVGLDVE